MVKNFDMGPYRKEIIMMLCEKLLAPQVLTAAKILNSIFDSFGIGEYAKY